MTAPRRLLILDDDEQVGGTISFVAESIGVEVRYTPRPGEFFAWIDTWQPSHLAIDLVMPEMDGVQVLAELARRGCAARIIITSGVGSRVLDAAVRSATEQGLNIAGALGKPFAAAVLRDMLRASGDAAAPRPAAVPAGGPPAVGAFEVNEEELRRAIERDELVVYCQPKIECANGNLAGFEALVRWQHPRHGLVMPDSFIPFAERAGLVGRITERVLERSLHWFSANLAMLESAAVIAPGSATRPNLMLSLNVSALALDDALFVERAQAACERQRLEPSRVILELTETSAMRNPVASLDLLTRLRMKGFELSIDDFGTGYSSMLQLVRLPFSEIKIDKSFVMTAMRSAESRAVIRSIVDLGRSLGLHSTAEGVEDAETLRHLREVGCDRAQGYFIARPLPKAEVLDWVRRWEDARRAMYREGRGSGQPGCR